MATAFVTGASRGVGRGVAAELAAQGFQVYGTGRSIAEAELPDAVVRLRCDHLRDEETARAFARVEEDGGEIDVLVNCAWGGYERMVEGGAFTWAVPFWEQPMHRWAGMIDGGVRAAFVAASHAAKGMVARRRGLIVNISYWPAQRHLGNTVYGVAHAVMDKMTRDMAHELRGHGVAVVSLYPGMVRTERVLEAAKGGWLDLANSESPEFIGRVVAGLWSDGELLERSGSVVVAARYARERGIVDVDGKQPEPLTLEALAKWT